MQGSSKPGFTLIELLIVVAIIAILAAIAIPNFIEAQVRSKVSHERANMRTIATALEAYRVDAVNYPERTGDLILKPLTTPVAYITSIPRSVFFDRSFAYTNIRNWYVEYYGPAWKDGVTAGAGNAATIGAKAAGTFVDNGHQWALASKGPDEQYNHGVWLIFGEDTLNRMPFLQQGTTILYWGCLYDSTNGTRSRGDIVRLGP